ncbi:hypothetical protein P6F26_11890 [Roseibacterium sp. SDUM158017]|uniref:hypothetical protein n=1 Tax=Roseicyclus salinarum TaxID=3036773 RepID=UPI00241574F3|nr:hypothetical protein [Roseibacterium sp. SDUM158017]MDG4649149.1 hypothetical protein [Roseibacterium sp. SDUM158017]
MVLRFAFASVLGLCFLVLLCLMLEDVYGVAITSGDENWFFPISWAYSETGMLFHPFATPVPDNPNGELIWHGWLTPLLLGALQPLAGYAHIKLSAHVLALAMLGGYAWFIVKRFGMSAAILCVPILGALFVYQAGRPELLLSGLILAYLLLFERADRLILDGLVLALLAVTSPVAGFMIGILMMLRRADDFPVGRDLLYHIARLCVVVPLLAGALTLFLAGLNPFEWIRGVATHGTVVVLRSDGQFIDCFIRLTEFPMSVLTIVLALILALSRFQRGQALSSVLLAMFVVSIWLFAIRDPSTVYNLLALTPLVLVDLLERQRRFFMIARSAVIGSMAVLALTSSIALARTGAMSVLNLQNGRNAAGFLDALDGLPTNGRLVFEARSAPLVMSALGDAVPTYPWDARRVTVRGHLAMANAAASEGLDGPTYRLIVQAHSGRLAPMLLAGECLLANAFHLTRPSIFGVAVGNTYKDFAFAIASEGDVCATDGRTGG